jgi:hypothetical protein
MVQARERGKQQASFLVSSPQNGVPAQRLHARDPYSSPAVSGNLPSFINY